MQVGKLKFTTAVFKEAMRSVKCARSLGSDAAKRVEMAALAIAFGTYMLRGEQNKTEMQRFLLLKDELPDSVDSLGVALVIFGGMVNNAISWGWWHESHEQFVRSERAPNPVHAKFLILGCF